ATGGDVATPGNVKLTSTALGGNVYSSKTAPTTLTDAQKTCASNNFSVTTNNAHPNLTSASGSNYFINGKINTFTPPALPDPTIPTVPANTSTCNASPTCNGNYATWTMPPNSSSNYGNVTFSSGTTVTLQSGGTYNMNNLTVQGGSKIQFPSSGNVVLNV